VFQLDLEFTNPLSISLTHVTVLVDGVHVVHTEVLLGTIRPGEHIFRRVWVRKFGGRRKGVIFVKVTMNEMWGIQEIIEADV